MTDVKKVAITSVPSSKGDKKESKRKRTVRLILNLPESNEKSCPEFNYGDLLSQHLSRRLGKAQLGDVINGPVRDKDDPYASDEDEALKALAKKFEQKYGGGVAGTSVKRKRKRQKENDFKQLGEGYDETDPFIDNSDAVDDVLPTNVETKFGGFYINSGELNFEEVHASDEDEDDERSNGSDIQNVKRKRKNEISSSEDEDDDVENEAEEEKEGAKMRENGILKKRKLDEGEMLRRRKKMIDKFNAKKQKPKEDLSENEVDMKSVEAEDEAKPSTNGTSIAASIEAVVCKAREGVSLKKIPETLPEEEEEQDEEEVEEGAGVEDTPTATVEVAEEGGGVEESRREEEREEGDEEEEDEKEDKEDSSSSESSSSSSSSESSSSESESEDEKEDKESGGKDESERKEVETEGMISPTPVSAVESEKETEHREMDCATPSDGDKDNTLPPNLPEDLITALDRLKEVGKNNNASSQKFFTENVNKMLLSVEIKLCKYGYRKKNQIYGHLSLHLPCGTQTLVKRGKALLAERLDGRLTQPMKMLKEALEKAMPPLIESHALECQKIAEKNPQQYLELYYHFWGEGTPPPEEEAAGGEAAQKKVKLPKKKFEFTAELRSLLCEIVKIRSQGWHMIKKRSETPDEHVKSFIDSHLKNLWPKGWVTTKQLYRETQTAHSFITSRQAVKPLVGKKVTVLGGGTVSNSNNMSVSILKTPEKDNSTGTAVLSETSPTNVDKVKAASSETGKPTNVASLLSSSSAASNKLQSEVDKKYFVSQFVQGKSVPEERESVAKERSSDALAQTPAVKHLADKASNDAVPKKVSPKVIPPKTSPKDTTAKPLTDYLLTSSISPVPSDSSPKSFHGFESPAKYHDGYRGHDGMGARQSLVFDSVKKVAKNSSENSDLLPPRREGKPPKPSLTATALPKISVANSVSISKADVHNRKGHTEYAEAPLPVKEDRKTITCISIKSVEKINETVHGKPDQKAKESGKPPEKDLSSKDKQTLSGPDTSKKSGDSVKVIDLESDEDFSTPPKGKSSMQRGETIDRIRSPISGQKFSSESTHMVRATPVGNMSVPKYGNEDFSRNNKLEQEMDQVFHELVQISMKNMKSNCVDESSSKKGSSLGPVVDSNKSAHPSKSLGDDILPHSKPCPLQKKPNAQQASSRAVVGSSPPVDLSPYRSKTSTQVVQPPKTSPVSSDAKNPKVQVHSNYQKNSSHQTPKVADISSMKQSSHSNNPHYGSDNRAVSASNKSSHAPSYGSQNSTQNIGGIKINQNSVQNAYQVGENASRNSLDSSFPKSQPTTPLSSHSGGHVEPSPSLLGPYPRPSSQTSSHSSSQSGGQKPVQQVESRKVSPSTHSEKSRKTSPSTQSSSRKTSPSHSGSKNISHPTHTGSVKTSPTHSGSYKTSPLTHSENRKSSPSSHSGSQRISTSSHSSSRKESQSSHSGSRKESPSSHSGNKRDSPSSHNGSRKSSPSSHSGSRKVSPSSHSGSHKTPPSSHGGSHRTSPATPSGSHRSLSQSASTPHRPSSSSSQGSSHRLASQSGNPGTPVSSHGGGQNSSLSSQSNNRSSLLTGGDHGSSSQLRGYHSAQSGLPGLPPTAAHHDQPKSQPSPRLKSPTPAHGMSARPSKPSHNIEELLYNSSSSSSKNNSPMNLTQSNYNHSQQQSSQRSSQHSAQSQQHHHSSSSSSAAQKTQSRFSASESSPWIQEQSHSSAVRETGSSSTKMPTSGSSRTSQQSSSKHRSNESTYSSTGDGVDQWPNVRLGDDLIAGGGNVSKKSQSLSVYSNSQNVGSSRTLAPSPQRSPTVSSAQPKVKQPRSDSFSQAMSHPSMPGSLAAKQQQQQQQQQLQDPFQHNMKKASSYLLSKLAPSEVYKYMSQQGLHQGTNSSSSSSKK